ncbi:DUF4236 domain-containing protein [Lapillicoccus jejuensis]|uniref:Uncharacterized protein DUF4236 n=1 Tax=Lapillicoccus jejuensis TaxID=402171 RepID=A0A542DWD4_9MICO|nr:uncharacterized protein DUF4236 [Lapillicoccus jejuensis]
MGFSFRKTIRVGPLRLTASRRGLGTSVGMGSFRVQSSRGRRRASARLPFGLNWRGRV